MGMTLREVEAILGPSDGAVMWNSASTTSWWDLGVRVNFMNNRVVSREWTATHVKGNQVGGGVK